jgi:anti-sigma regulatory factor (Ser/Thr protein kinase)
MQSVAQQGIDIDKIRDVLKANIYAGKVVPGDFTTGIYASDLMSDVLAFGKSGSILITGLNTIQVAVSAYIAEFKGIIIIRSKVPDKEILSFADEKHLFVLSTDYDMYEACVKIANIKSEESVVDQNAKSAKKQGIIITKNFHIDGADFGNTDMVSTQVKAILKSIGYDPELIRRVSICTYEAEMNVVMHAIKADVTLTASDKEIGIIIDDEGKGIENIELAMQEGYSTATEEQRALGFGAGMGLPNIKKNCDVLNIESKVQKGTFIEIRFHVQ